MSYGSQDGVETKPLHKTDVRKNWFQQNANTLMGGIIIVLLACVGLSSYNNNHGRSVQLSGRHNLRQHLYRSEYLNVGMPCEDSEECRPCANETERVHCSDLRGNHICWCKAKRLDVGEQCYTAGECNPKACKAKGLITLCAGHPQTCKCKPPSHGKKHECLHDDDCPKCGNKNETSRCAGTPLTCKPCAFKYIDVNEECSHSDECLRCADANDTPKCRSVEEGKPKICTCKEERLTEGQQCFTHRECKCGHGDQPWHPTLVAECAGHPRHCRCAKRGVKKVGDQCRQEEECKACVNPDDKPACVASSNGETRICQCKLHRLYPGEKCFGREECKPKTCVRAGLEVECAGDPEVCRCKRGREDDLSSLEALLRKLFGLRR